MSHIVPFTIGHLELRHDDDDESSIMQAADEWTTQASSAVPKLIGRSFDRLGCPKSERTVTLSVFRDNQFVGMVALYRMRAVGSDENVVSSLIAPMLGGLEYAFLPAPAVTPGGQSMPHDPVAQDRQRDYWRRTFTIMEFLLEHPMALVGGGSISVAEWRFPSADDGDPDATEWHQGRDHFDQWARKEVSFVVGARGDLVPLRMTNEDKLTDPDPSRPALDVVGG